jgi:YD repeat-containing protein
MTNCQGCGSVLENPTLEEVNQTVDAVLTASLEDAKKHGEICPLCGHSQAHPISHRKSVQFALLLATLLIASGTALAYYLYRHTERALAAHEVLRELDSDSQITQLLGKPLSIQEPILGQVKQDETGWHEVKLTIAIHGPRADGVVRVEGGRENGPWHFTTLEVLMPQVKKKADLITGRIVEYDPSAYVITHTEAVGVPEYTVSGAPPPSWNGDFPCVYAMANPVTAPQVGTCTTPVPMSAASRRSVDRFETDLRRGKFIMRQSDLSIHEAGFDIPLTRTYSSEDWISQNKSHAFGLGTNHPYDIAPVGTRNPYTELYIVLEDADVLYFPRISKGTGYSDAVYRQSEVGNGFYNAIQRWDGMGWLLQLQDGSIIHFPESYNAKSLAQGAPTDMTDPAGNRIELVRDGRRNLQEIRGPYGKSIKLAYDDHNRIVHAEDGNGNWTNYRYNPAGFLTDVSHSDGTARYYFYEDGLLTFIRDEAARLLVHNVYQNGKLTWQQYGNNDTIQYRYVLSSNGYYPERVSLTLPDDTLKEIAVGSTVSEIYQRMH